MKYFGPTDKKLFLTDEKYMPLAKLYWGPGPLPKGAEIIGGYSDRNHAGALIRLANGNLVCGNAGAICMVSN